MSRALSPENVEARETHGKILSLKKAASVAFIYIGREMKRMKDNNYWQFIVGEQMTWTDYCRAELDFDISYANSIIQIYEQFVLRLEFHEDDLSDIKDTRKLLYLLPLIKDKDKEEVQEYLDHAKALSRNDFVKLLKQETNPPDKCPHQPKKVEYWFCVKCQERLSEGEVELYAR